MLLLISDCSGHLVTLPAPPIRCLCVDFVRVTKCFYDYDYDYLRTLPLTITSELYKSQADRRKLQLAQPRCRDHRKKRRDDRRAFVQARQEMNVLTHQTRTSSIQQRNNKMAALRRPIDRDHCVSRRRSARAGY